MDATTLMPLVIEVLAPSVVGAGVTRLMAQEAASRSPRPGDPGGEQAFRLWKCLDRLRETYGERIVVHLIEPLSFAWMIRVLRFRPKAYPAFVVGRSVISGLDEDAVARSISTLLHAVAAG